jgi:predicted SAM-dependent methyltransferase
MTEGLSRLPGYWRVRRIINTPRSRRVIRRYLDEQKVRQLNVGAGPRFAHEAYRGWLSADIGNPVRSHGGIYSAHVDLTRPLPFPTASFDYILSQHCIEHFPYHLGRNLLRECRRVLKPGGVMRLETPDVNYYINRYGDGTGPLDPEMAKVAQRDMRAPPTHLTALNSIFRLWEHQYIYDPAALTALCHDVGFQRVVQMPMRMTDVDALKAPLAFNPSADVEPHHLESSFALEAIA